MHFIVEPRVGGRNLRRAIMHRRSFLIGAGKRCTRMRAWFLCGEHTFVTTVLREQASRTIDLRRSVAGLRGGVVESRNRDI